MDTEENTINLYDAVSRMYAVSAEGGMFSMKFRKWNRDTRTGGAIESVTAARLRPRASDEQVAHARFKLFYTDYSDSETGLPRVCWQPLVVEFNGMRTVLD